jgi:hypothetical protein
MTAAPKNTEKKATGRRVTRRPPRGRLRRLLIPLLILAAVTVGMGTGLFVSRILDVPSIYELEDYTPSLTTVGFILVLTVAVIAGQIISAGGMALRMGLSRYEALTVGVGMCCSGDTRW